jgi:hypothetical protein
MVAVNLIPERNIPVKFAPDRPTTAPDGQGFLPGNRLERDIREILNRS